MNKVFYGQEQHIKKFADNIPAEYIPEYLSPLVQEDLYNFLSSHYPSYKGIPTVPFVRVQYDKFAQLRSTPRLTWCYGQFNGNETASYRGRTFKTEPIPQWLIDLKTPIEEYLGIDFNAVIINKYQSGEDHINWHQDDEKFLEHHVVASISIGAERIFQMRDSEKGIIHEIQLKNGSLVIFDGVRHSLPKRANVKGIRFNITFRKVKDNNGIGNYYYYSRGF
jgi:alkylated DNA repair dioxygenase AlkB